MGYCGPMSVPMQIPAHLGGPEAMGFRARVMGLLSERRRKRAYTKGRVHRGKPPSSLSTTLGHDHASTSTFLHRWATSIVSKDRRNSALMQYLSFTWCQHCH